MGLLHARLEFGDGLFQWITPTINQGQIVEISYGRTEHYIFERRQDHSDQTTIIEAYKTPVDDDADNWGPWNSVPKLGDRVGVVYSSLESTSLWFGQAFNLGCDARFAGVPREKNPFPKGSDERAEWFLGYDIG